MLRSVGAIFGSKLKAHREARGLSGYRLSLLAGMGQPLENALEQGKRGPSQANLEALAAVEELGLPLEVLQAWADADRVGAEGIERIKKHAPELLGLPAEPARPLTFEERMAKNNADREAKRIADLPKEHYGTVAAGWDANPVERPDHPDADHGDGDFQEDSE